MRHALFILPLLLCGYVHAETVFMKDGQSVVGDIIWRGRAGVELRVAPGCVGDGRKVFIETKNIESVNDCADCGGEYGINEVPESRLEFEKRMHERGRVYYKDRWVRADERDADEARIKAEKEKAAEKAAEKIVPLTPATPKAAPRATPVPEKAPAVTPAPAPTPAPVPAPPAK